jgi:hypothetical protein
MEPVIITGVSKQAALTEQLRVENVLAARDLAYTGT